jgi:uncharacterized protein (TIGR02145 family)
MKKTVLNTLALATLFFASTANAQVGVGVPAGDIHPTAELEVKSTTKGFLPPRMTNAERNDITSPAAGLLIYQTDAVANNPAGLYFYDGTAWKNGIGAQGAVGPKGDKGDKGETGVTGSMPSGTTLGEMKYWDGTKWASLKPVTNGQILTYCEGLPTWTFNGKCPNPTSGFGPNIADEDGNSYKTVYIGTQKWMAENLRTTKYNDGTMIPLVIDPTKWAENFNKKSTLPMMSWYNNDNSIATKYGALYNWYAITPLYNEDKNVCPYGWHLPSDDEWAVLLNFIEGDGGKLKTEGLTDWKSPNRFATNTSGFSALPAGFRDEAGNYEQISTNGKWWSSNQNVPFISNAWYRDLNNGNGALFRSFYDKSAGLSVRCVED